MIDGVIYYDLNNDLCQCVKITKDCWEIIESPMIFTKHEINRKQDQPTLLFEEIAPENQNRRWVRELIDRLPIKHDYQKIIAEIYVIPSFHSVLPSIGFWIIFLIFDVDCAFI